MKHAPERDKGRPPRYVTSVEAAMFVEIAATVEALWQRIDAALEAADQNRVGPVDIEELRVCGASLAHEGIHMSSLAARIEREFSGNTQ